MRIKLGSLFLGAILVTIGSAMIYHPLGFVVPGIFLMVAALKPTKKAE